MAPTITLNEHYYNYKIIEDLLRVDTGDPKYDSENLLWVSEQTKLRNIDKHTREGVNRIEYRLPSYGLGRLVPKDGRSSYQAMFNVVRRLVLDGKATSVDGCCMQPALLAGLLEKYTKPREELSCLAKYVADTKDIRARVAKAFGVSTDAAKKLFITLCFGGTPDQWREDRGIAKECCTPKFVNAFHHEMCYIRQDLAPNAFPKYARFEEVAKAKPERGTKKSEGKNKTGSEAERSAIAIYLQNLERRIFNVVREWCASNELPVIALVHDEVLIDGVRDVDLSALSAYVLEKTGYKISFESKGTAPTEEDVAWFDAHKPFMREGDKYDDVKARFEELCFKINNTGEFAYEYENDLVIMNKKTFTTRWEEWTYKTEKKGEQVEAPFLDTWYKDETKRVYDRIDFLPTPIECPDRVYNTWKGFDIERLDVEPKSCDKVLELIKTLCGDHEESYEYFMDWLAQMFQSPATKTGTAVVFRSNQGAGKGTLLEILRSMMGVYVAETSNPAQDIFGTHGNVHVKKILTSRDEVKSSDTSKELARLKNLITSPKCVYNEKGQKMVEVNNSSRFIFTTNDTFPISLDGKDDRRYAIFECSNRYCKDTAFWKEFYTAVVGDCRVIKGFYNVLMDRNVADRDWMAFPKTELRNDLMNVAMHPIIGWFDHFIHNTCVPLRRYSSSKLFEQYSTYCLNNGMKHNSNVKAFGVAFSKHIPTACGISKVKSHGIATFEFDREACFRWLKDNEYSEYEDCGVMEDPDDLDE